MGLTFILESVENVGASVTKYQMTPSMKRVLRPSQGIASSALKADGWYVSLSLEDATVPVLSPNFNAGNAVGIDMGLTSLLVTSDIE